jgi:hypothetical protein
MQELKPLSRVSTIRPASGWGFHAGRRGGKSGNFLKFVGKNAETPRGEREVFSGIFWRKARIFGKFNASRLMQGRRSRR